MALHLQQNDGCSADSLEQRQTKCEQALVSATSERIPAQLIIEA
jgi:hypothetical protein